MMSLEPKEEALYTNQQHPDIIVTAATFAGLRPPNGDHRIA